MKTKVRGRYVNGRVELTGPTPEWVDGTELDIGPHRNGVLEDDDYDDERIETPEKIEAWIREFESIPPLVLTAEEEANFEEWNRKVGEYSKEAVRRQWEFGIEGSPP